MLRTFQGCFNEISKKFQASFKRARDDFMEVSIKYFMAISRVFSKVFQRVFIFFFRLFKDCSVFDSLFQRGNNVF